MVYLLTSNTQKTGEVGEGINNPASYVNMLSQTFEIEKDSEIAVESLKITRNGNLQISSANNKFGIYLGRDIRQDTFKGLFHSFGFPVPTRITAGNDSGNVTRSPLDLCNNIREGMLQSLGQHPNFVDINTVFPKVELKNGSNEFTGFKYSFSQNLSGEKTNIPATAGDGWVATTIGDINCTVSASGTSVKLLKDGDESLYGDLSVIGQKYPINSANGSVVFNVNSSANGSAGELWEVGLTRATFNACQVDPSLAGAPSIFKDKISPVRFFDYSVRVNGLSKRLEVCCCSTNGFEGTGFAKAVKVVLLDAGDVTLDATVKSIKFIVNNDTVDIDCIKFDGTVVKLIENAGKTDKMNMTKPICASYYYLYPKVNIYDNPSASRVMVVEGYDGLNIPTYNFKTTVNSSFQYGGRFRGEALTPALLGFKCDGDLTYQDYGVTALWTGKEGSIKLIDERPPLDYDDTTLPDRKLLNASGGLNKNIIILTAPDNAYNGGLFRGAVDTEEADFYAKFTGDYTDRFGAQNLMGFENVPLQITNTFTTPGTNLGVKESKTTPTMTSNKSLFIRLPDLPINSFNSGKGSVSKILYHMPRFDNSGNEVGGLYYQPPERLYIPLGNVEKIRLNNIKIELCNIDERTVTELVGQTIVCFDIRRRQRL